MPTIIIDGTHPVIQEHLTFASAYVLEGKEGAYKDIAQRPFNTIVLDKFNRQIISNPEPSANIATLKFNVELGPNNLDLLNGLKILGGQFQLSAMWILIADGVSLQHPTPLHAVPACFHAVEQKRLIWQFKKGAEQKDDYILGESYQDFFRAQWDSPQSNPQFPKIPASEWWAYARQEDGLLHPVPIDEGTSILIQSYCKAGMSRQTELKIKDQVFEPFMTTDLIWSIRKSDGMHPVLHYESGKINLKCPSLLFKSATGEQFQSDRLPPIIDDYCYEEGAIQKDPTVQFHSSRPTARKEAPSFARQEMAPSESLWHVISSWLWPSTRPS